MSVEKPAESWNGLTRKVDGLPAERYHDAAHYERELARVWYRNWIYVGRSSELAEPRSFLRFTLGEQQVLLVRDDQGVLQAFHNTCRHRGASLCRDHAGRLATGSIVCPYHAWVYDLQGRLRRTSSRQEPEGFDKADYPLYRIRVTEWSGFMFVALSGDAPPFAQSFDQDPERLAAWDLGRLVVGHRFAKTLACNWKVFWENYNECLHCPGVHPELSRLVPIFGRALMEERDDPRWQDHAGDDDPKYHGGLRRGAESWSSDGTAGAARFPNLSAEDRRLGHVYLTSLPSVFIVGHVDYVRVVRVLPLGPERTELNVEYLFAPQTVADPAFDPAKIVVFTARVMAEDADVCELNQQGLRAVAHKRGVIMPEEYLIQQLHEWIEAQLRGA